MVHNDGVFDTSLEDEYTPCLATALATAILEVPRVSISHLMLHNMQGESSFHFLMHLQRQNSPAVSFSSPLSLCLHIVLSLQLCHVLCFQGLKFSFTTVLERYMAAATLRYSLSESKFASDQPKRGVRSVASGAAGQLFMVFPGLPAEVKDACVHVVESEKFGSDKRQV